MHRPGDTPSLSARVLYEDNHLIAVNKLPGDIVQGDKSGDTPLSELVKKYIGEKYNKPGEVYLGVVHRLDRPVSGVVLFARTSKALARMNELIKERQVQKTYWAVTYNRPEQDEGELRQYLRKDEAHNKSYVTRQEGGDSKLAELTYRVLGMGDKHAFLEIGLKTGRHHQIRAQLTHMGCIIRGDLKYGAPRSNSNGSIHLHARSMGFMHPVKNTPVRITADPPRDALWDSFMKIAGKSSR